MSGTRVDRVTVVGNGPSLKKVNLELLRGVCWVSFNRAYIMYKELNLYPSYYFCIDKTVLLNCLPDIEQLIASSPIQHFVLLDCPETHKLGARPNVSLVRKEASNAEYFGDVSVFSIHYLFTHRRIANFDVYGCDCHYVEDPEKLNVDVIYNDKDPAQRVSYRPKKGASDPNHFRSDYFDESTMYSIPRTKNHERNWHTLSKIRAISVVFRTPSKASGYFGK